MPHMPSFNQLKAYPYARKATPQKKLGQMFLDKLTWNINSALKFHLAFLASYTKVHLQMIQSGAFLNEKPDNLTSKMSTVYQPWFKPIVDQMLQTGFQLDSESLKTNITVSREDSKACYTIIKKSETGLHFPCELCIEYPSLILTELFINSEPQIVQMQTISVDGGFELDRTDRKYKFNPKLHLNICYGDLTQN